MTDMAPPNRPESHDAAKPHYNACSYCGYLDWTVEKYGRVTHKEGCPMRTDPWHQGDPRPDTRSAASERKSHTIIAWVCDECGYWRKDESTGVHQTTNPDDPNGKLVVHPLRRAMLVEVDGGF